MFGPDKYVRVAARSYPQHSCPAGLLPILPSLAFLCRARCGTDAKLHFIYTFENPTNGKMREVMVNRLDNAQALLFTDKKTHLVTLSECDTVQQGYEWEGSVCVYYSALTRQVCLFFRLSR